MVFVMRGGSPFALRLGEVPVAGRLVFRGSEQDPALGDGGFLGAVVGDRIELAADATDQRNMEQDRCRQWPPRTRWGAHTRIRSPPPTTNNLYF
jgi:hypothetical protein